MNRTPIYDIFPSGNVTKRLATYSDVTEDQAIDLYIQDVGEEQAGDVMAVLRPYEGPWAVAVYRVDRAFGGPEEGGWYYTCGELILDNDFPLPSFHRTEAEALKALHDMDTALEPHNEGRRPISSVLSDGVYQARLCEGMPEPHFPTVRPHYE